ncbi:His/Gly/Thr/Pro-type tRNA ligase C-terminal domain-containing protein, partial [Oleiphilus sp. HI0086]
LHKAFEVAELLRSETSLRVLQNAGGGSFKSQMKKADKSGAPLGIIIGEQELENDTLVVKRLKGEGGQKLVSFAELLTEVNSAFS